MPEKTPEGEYPVHPEGVEEVVADKAYHSNDALRELRTMEVRTYMGEPERGRRNWKGVGGENKPCM